MGISSAGCARGDRCISLVEEREEESREEEGRYEGVVSFIDSSTCDDDYDRPLMMTGVKLLQST